MWPSDTKTMVSTGPFVIVDGDAERTPVSERGETSIVPNSVQSVLPAEAIAPVPPVLRSRFAAPSQGVVALSQDPATRLAPSLPEQVENAELGFQSEDGAISQLQQSLNDIPEMWSSTTDRESQLNPTNEVTGQSFSGVPLSDMNLLTMVDGWVIPPKESERKIRFGRSGNSGSQEEQVDFSLPAQVGADYLLLAERPNSASDTAAAEEPRTEKWLQNGEIKDLNRDELQKDEIPPITRSKLTVSKAADGSQTLSYEVVKQSPVEGDPLRLKGLCSTFLNLLR